MDTFSGVLVAQPQQTKLKHSLRRHVRLSLCLSEATLICQAARSVKVTEPSERLQHTRSPTKSSRRAVEDATTCGSGLSAPQGARVRVSFKEISTALTHKHCGGSRPAVHGAGRQRCLVGTARRRWLLLLLPPLPPGTDADGRGLSQYDMLWLLRQGRPNGLSLSVRFRQSQTHARRLHCLGVVLSLIHI